MIGRRIRSTIRLSAAQTPSATPTPIVIRVAMSTCESVPIEVAHSPVAPIVANMIAVIAAGRSPLTRNAIATMPTNITGQGVSTKKFVSGWSPRWTMKLPVGSVMWKIHVDGFCT